MSVAAGAKVRASDISRIQYGYLFSEKVIYTANGSFSKGSYAGLRAVRVICVGGGGGSGGCAATAAGEGATSGGGAGGTYSETWILAASLAATETITIGAGGTAGSAGNNSGGVGGTTSFGTLCIANGGTLSTGAANTSTTTGGSGGVAVTTGAVGDLIIIGQDGNDGRHSSAGLRLNDAFGGTSGLGYGPGRSESNTTASAAGINGQVYGGGASGAHNEPSQSAVAGGTGGAGICIVEVYV